LGKKAYSRPVPTVQLFWFVDTVSTVPGVALPTVPVIWVRVEDATSHPQPPMP
jgi:hypothetical protein